MIALLTGRLAAVGLGDVVLDVNGVGYAVLIAPGTRVGAQGETVTLHTHLAVREDAMTLYGFPDPQDKAVFTTLLGVTGVGPKLALAAIGALGADGLRRAVLAEDVGALTVIPGVGKKGAQRMILELRERLGAPGDGVPGATTPGGASADPRAEVREALGSLGYAAAEVQKVLDGLPANGEASAEDLLRDALRSLGRGRV
jgi:holliday junction DNA helicase RuvA